MTVVNSAFTVNGSLPTDAVAVGPGSVVTLAVQSLTGINGIVWSVVGNDKATRVNPTITPAGSPPGATATFNMPGDAGDGLGQGYAIQCVASDGASPANTSTTVEIVGIANMAGFVPFTAGEDLARDSTYGWGLSVNRLLAGAPRSVTQAQTVDATLTVVASLPIPVDTCAAIELHWVGRRADSLAIARRESRLTVYRLSTGNVTQLGSTNDLLATAKTDGTWGAPDFALNTGTQAVDVRVTGKAATIINWSVEIYATFK